MTKIQILTPFFNEEEQIPITIERMIPIMETLGDDVSLLMVDDGSKDTTWDKICEGAAKYPTRVKGVRFSRNFGKEAALLAGMDASDCDALVIMDGDLQHPPEKIAEMVDLWKQGYEVVEGVKSERQKESFGSKMNAIFFYGFFKKISGYDLNNASDFKLLDRRVIDTLCSMPEHNTFFRGMAAWVGFKRTTFTFEVQDRETGHSRWNFGKLIKLSVDAITSFSSVPLQLITMIGSLFMIGAFILAIQTLVRFFMGNAADGFTTVILVTLLIGACIMVSLGLIGTYIAKIFDEVKRRPRYIVSEDTNRNTKDKMNKQKESEEKNS